MQRLRVQSPKLIIHVWRTQYSTCDLNTVSRLQPVSLLHFKFCTLLKGGGVQAGPDLAMWGPRAPSDEGAHQGQKKDA